jgi:hypothetical protein
VPTQRKSVTLLVCFLVEALKTILDHAIEMNDQYLIGMCRRFETSYETALIDARKRARLGNERILTAIEILLDRKQPRSEALDKLFETIPEDDLQQAVSDCRVLRHVELFGYAEALESSLSHLNRYQPQFFELPFEAQRGSELVLAAVNIARRLYRGELRSLPSDAHVSFVDADLRASVKQGEGPFKQHTPGRSHWDSRCRTTFDRATFTCRKAAITDTSGT